MAIEIRNLFVCVVFELFLSFPRPVVAQDTKLPEQTIERLFKTLHFDSSDPRVGEIVDKVMATAKTSAVSASQVAFKKFQGKYPEGLADIRKSLPYVPAQNFQTELARVKIYKHFRSTGGTPLKQITKPSPLSEKQQESVKAAQARLLNGMLSSLKALKTAKVPACTEDRISKKKLKAPKEAADGFVEVLFLRNSKPLDPDELYGSKVKVYTCVQDGIDRCVVPFHEYGLACLPARLKISNKEIVLIEGKAALLNYDKKKTGEMHPSVKAQLGKLME